MCARISAQPGSTEESLISYQRLHLFLPSCPEPGALDLPGPTSQPLELQSSTYPLLISCHCKGYMKSAEGVAQQLFKTTLNLEMT